MSTLQGLPQHLHIFLSQLAVFRGGWTVETAAAICRTSCAEKWCEELTDLGLVTKINKHEDVRYVMTDVLRKHIKGVCDESQWKLWEREFVAYFTKLIHLAAPHLRYVASKTWTLRLNAEKENLYAAIDLSRGEQCVELVCSLWKWGLERSDFERMRDKVLIAMSRCQPIPQHRQVEMYQANGVLSGRLGQRNYGILLLYKALYLAEKYNQIESIPDIHHNLCVILRQIGKYAESESHHKRSYALWCEQGNPFGQAISQYGAGVLYWAQNRLDESRAAYIKSGQLCEEIGDDVLAAVVLLNLACVAEAQQNYEAALKSYFQCLSKLRKTEDRYYEMHCLNNIAVTFSRCGNFHRAREYFRKSLEAAQEYGYEEYITVIIAGMAEYVDKSGNQNRAVILFGAYDAFSQKYKNVASAVCLAEINSQIAGLRRRVRPRLFEGLWKKGQLLSKDKIIKTLLD